MGADRPKLIFPAGWNVEAKPCDYCKSAAALLFCRADSAFLCVTCDAKVHSSDNNKLMCLMKHPRVWMCEVCEQAPAAVNCKADAAALCVTCDRDIHSANPLARRHERVPVVPFYDTAAESLLMKPSSDTCVAHDNHEGYNFPDSWISANPIVVSKVETPDLKSMDFLFSDSTDQFLEFDNFSSHQPYSDSIVPVQTTIRPPVPAQSTNLDHSTENQFEIDFTKSNMSSYNNSYTTPSLSHSFSSSSLDAGVVPDGSTMSDTSYHFGRNMNSSFDLNGNQSSQVVGTDREARVLRYREKRKNRKFEKTIRYASRKAYAETRPRIKGRFAKRNEADHQSDIHRIFSPDFIAGAGYGVVPSF